MYIYGHICKYMWFYTSKMYNINAIWVLEVQAQAHPAQSELGFGGSQEIRIIGLLVEKFTQTYFRMISSIWTIPI